MEFRNLLFPFFLLIALFPIKNASGQDSILTSRHYETLSGDGAWCWFSDPRALYVEGRHKQLISGCVSKKGDILISCLNLETGVKSEKVFHRSFNKDDHANPSFLILPDKKIIIFYSQHGGKESKIFYSTTKNPEDISEWEETKNIPTNTPGGAGYCYTNPVLLSREKNRIYLFWRGGNYNPTYSFSDDLGKTWSPAAALILSSDLTLKRPYLKVCSNNIDEIHFAFTDGHPRNEPLNSIYYMKYRNGCFYKANNEKICGIQDLPVKNSAADKVYDASLNYDKPGNGERAWIWDIAIDSNNNPVLVYTRLPEETLHRYYYARSNGLSWDNYIVSDAGRFFPRNDLSKNEREPEPHYSGGICIDHSDPSSLFLSKPVKGVFEIFSYSTADGGRTWTNKSVTQNSLKDNVRPYVVLNAGSNINPRLLWMYGDYKHYTDFSTSIKDNRLNPKPADDFNSAAVKNALKSVADWQIAEPLRHDLTDWTNGALYAGMAEWAKASGDEKYFDWLKDIGSRAGWKLGERTYMADDHCIGQMYIELFRKYNDKKMIGRLKSQFDWILGNPSRISLKFKSDSVTHCTDRWSWCDAVFMGPTVWTKLANITGQKKYLDFMYDEFKLTTDYLYDREEHLYFRDDTYFGKKEMNGKKIFWGRGNGWVIAGLAIILQELPKEYSGRKYIEEIFTEMSEKLASLQDKNGYWHASLLDPESYPNPETSASCFNLYGLAWGVNNGYLDPAEYKPAIEKGWKALIKTIHTDGKLGYVQPIGAAPKSVTIEMTEVYGVGAFLLAGTEILKML